jgi:sterol-4alpha-carboxylate 3-dehydrogenase (decarboxylating)
MASSQSLSPVLVTGGCGFIGFHIVQHLLSQEADCQVHVLDINTTRNRVPNPNVHYHNCDIASTTSVHSVLQEAQPRTIFHLACPDSMIINPQLFTDVNIHGTDNLLSSARQAGTVQALVLTSTSSVIHDNVSDLLDADEAQPILQPPAQKRIYTLTKAAAEEAVLTANRAHGNASMLTCSLRPAIAIGEADTICLGKMIAVAEQGKTRFQMGNGRNVYDFAYVGNVAEAHILAARRLLSAYGKPPPPPAERVDGEYFHITNDERVLFWDFTRQIAAEAGHPVKREEIVVIPLWIGLLMAHISAFVVWVMSRGKRQPEMTIEAVRLSTIHRTLNGEKARRVLGYKPTVRLDEAIARGVRWYAENKQTADGKAG